MKKLVTVLGALIVVLALVVILYPQFSSKETLTYDEAVKALPDAKFVKVDGKNVHYIEKGEGKPVILLHGYMYHTMAWDKNIDALAKHFKVYAVDHWGFGYSERLEGMNYSYPMFGKEVVGFMDALKIDKASIGGHSMGGGTSTYVAAHHPDRVDKVVLVAPAVYVHEPNAVIKLFGLPFIGEFMSALPNDLILKGFVQEGCFTNPGFASDEYFQELYEPLKIKGSGAAALYITRNLFVPPGLKPEADQLAKSDIPILIVHGDKDPLVPFDDAKTLNKLWKNSQLAVFEGAKHNPHEDYADKFNKVVIEFLSK